MTNREWMQQQSDIEFAKAISENLTNEYPIDIVRWLNAEHYQPKELTHEQVCQAFEFMIANRRVIGPDEIKRVIEDLFK